MDVLRRKSILWQEFMIMVSDVKGTLIFASADEPWFTLTVPRTDLNLARQIMRYGFLVTKPLTDRSSAHDLFQAMVTSRAEFRALDGSKGKDLEASALLDQFHQAMNLPNSLEAVQSLCKGNSL